MRLLAKTIPVSALSYKVGVVQTGVRAITIFIWRKLNFPTYHDHAENGGTANKLYFKIASHI